jgi:hypothetical protein
MSSPARAARLHRAAWTALALFLSWSAWRGAATALRAGAASDFRIYWEAGRAAIEGRDPCAVAGFIYLPAFAVLVIPFAALPFAAAVVAWQATSLAATLFAAAKCARIAVRDGLAGPPWLAWASLLCVARLADSNLGNGQVNAIVFAVLLLGVGAWIEGRGGRAGAWIGLATAIKVVPICVGLAFLTRRSGKAVLATAAAAAGFALVLPAVFFGPSRSLEGLATWWREQAHPYAVGGETLLASREYLPGQSLTAVAYRLLCATPATSQPEGGPTANFADLPPAEVAWIVRGLEALYLFLLLASLARSIRVGAPGARSLEVSLVLAVALTLAPLVHKAHLLWMMLPYAVLLARPARPARTALLALSVALTGLTAPSLLGPLVATWATAHNLIFLGVQLALAALLLEAWAPPARAT